MWRRAASGVSRSCVTNGVEIVARGHVPHLWKRRGWFYLRLTFPKTLQAQVGRAEINVALRTQKKSVAAAAAYAGALAFGRLCDTLRSMTTLDDIDVHALVRAFHAQRRAEMGAPALPNGEQSRDAEWVAEQAGSRALGLEEVIEASAFDDPDGETLRGEAAFDVRGETTRLAALHGFDLCSLSEQQRATLMHGVARAMLDDHRRFLHELADRLTPYASSDPFFAQADGLVVEQPSTPAHADASPSLSQAIDAYISAKAGVAWGKKTEKEFRRVFRWVREAFGADTPIGSITKKQVRDWRDDIIRVRRHAKPNAPFQSLLTDDASQQVHRKTSAKHFQLLVSAFNWWVAEGYIENSPVGKLTVVVPKSSKAKARTPFTQDELDALFSSPIFTGCKSANRRTTPGPHMIRDGYYWTPLIGTLSGMRLGEIVQLGVGDIDADADIPVIHVRVDEDLGGTVKSDAGWRDVPIHRRLIELGFLDFVKARQAKTKAGRIFEDIPYGSDGSPSAEYSRWFGRRMEALGLKRPGLVFHSFRHTFIDALREASTPGYVLKAIVGHEQSGVTDGYGQGVTLAQKREWTNRVELLEKLPTN